MLDHGIAIIRTLSMDRLSLCKRLPRAAANRETQINHGFVYVDVDGTNYGVGRKAGPHTTLPWNL